MSIWLMSLNVFANEIKPFNFNNIILGGYPDATWEGRYIYAGVYSEFLPSCDLSEDVNNEYNVKRNKEYTIRVDNILPFTSILVETTLNTEKIYHISPELNDNYFKSYEQCKIFMTKIIKKIQSEHSDVKYSEFLYDNKDRLTQSYKLTNSLKQSIEFRCLTIKDDSSFLKRFTVKNTKHNFTYGSIDFIDTMLENKVSDEVTRSREKAKRYIKRKQKDTHEDNAVKLFK